MIIIIEKWSQGKRKKRRLRYCNPLRLAHCIVSSDVLLMMTLCRFHVCSFTDFSDNCFWQQWACVMCISWYSLCYPIFTLSLLRWLSEVVPRNYTRNTIAYFFNKYVRHYNPTLLLPIDHCRYLHVVVIYFLITFDECDVLWEIYIQLVFEESILYSILMLINYLKSYINAPRFL